jgi:4-hydroxyphenylpyruvate dioxygenase
MPNDVTGSRRTAIATVCLSGTLEDKLPAAAAAGFTGVEIFEPDLVATRMPPDEIRRRCDDLGLSIDLYQPFRDFEAVPAEQHKANLRRAERKFDVMEQLGTDTILLCSSVSPDAIDDDDLAAEQLHALAERAAGRGLKLAYEALAWGRFVNTWDHSWEIVRRGDHPALGLCLDSFHVLSRGSATEGFATIPGEKIFFLQLADAPPMDMGVLQWSRHHRLFPGQGAFDLVDFLDRVLAAGYEGPLSLEVFNDVFRQAEPRRTAVDGLRSLLVLQEQVARRADAGTGPPRSGLTRPPAPPATSGWGFGELSVDGTSGPALTDVLTALGFTHTGQHRSKPVQLWEQDGARIVVNWAPSRPSGGVTEISALAVESADAATSVRRAESLLAPVLDRTRGAGEADLSAVAAPDGTQIFFTGAAATTWLRDFLPTGAVAPRDAGITHIDHIALTQPFDAFDEAALFYRAVLGLEPQQLIEFAAPFGLLRNRAMRNADGTVRIPLSVSLLRRGSWAPGVRDPQHVAFGCRDIVATAAALRAGGTPLLAIPDNYYDDLDARLELDPALLAALRAGGILYDRDADGEFFHLYTEVLGSRLFFEVVQRVGHYDGYGAVNAPVHMAAHHRSRVAGVERRAEAALSSPP